MKLKKAYSNCMACGGMMKKAKAGMMVPGVNGTVMASAYMPKKGQSFTNRKPGSANLKAKAKARLKK